MSCYTLAAASKVVFCVQGAWFSQYIRRLFIHIPS